MTPIRLLIAAAMTASIAAPAFAQTAPAPTDMSNPPPAAAAETMATPASATTVDPNTGQTVILQSTSSPEVAAKLKAGDPNVVSNGPVPDTAENRARYGSPMSNGGKRTVPAGN
jgi:hypothetical protein